MDETDLGMYCGVSALFTWRFIGRLSGIGYR